MAWGEKRRSGRPGFPHGPRVAWRSPRSLGGMGTNVLTLPPAPTGPIAGNFYPKLVQHKRSARNTHIPEAGFLRALNAAQNHVLAYRRKTFFTVADYINHPTGASGTATVYRFRCHTGYAARYLTFDMGLGYPDNRFAFDPSVVITVTYAGGSTATTGTVRYGGEGGGATPMPDYPDQIVERQCRLQILPNTTYEVKIAVAEYGRILDIVAYEEAAPNIDTTVDYFVNESESGVGYPVYDATRQRMLQGLSEIWKRNGPQLLTWAGGPGIAASPPTYNNPASWSNILSDAASAPSSSTPGYYLGDATFTLEKLARLTGNKSVDVVFATYASADTGGSIRLQDASGTRCTGPTIGTAEQWYATATTIANLDTLGKVDLEAITTGAPGQNVRIYAVSIYAYL